MRFVVDAGPPRPVAQSKVGGGKVKETVAGSDVAALLQHDPEFDGDMPGAADFLKQNGLDVLA